jgi:hypothetical protein
VPEISRQPEHELAAVERYQLNITSDACSLLALSRAQIFCDFFTIARSIQCLLHGR